MRTILKVLVGSRAHGLAREGSDADYRGVFVNSTLAILAAQAGLGERPRDTAWLEGEVKPDTSDMASDRVDDTAWELGHFLNLAARGNSTALEVLWAPVVESTAYGARLHVLRNVAWSPRSVRDAFVGYASNQRKKFLAGMADPRARKYACANLRVLYQGWRLLEPGELPVDLRGALDDVYATLTRWRDGDYTVGEVVEACCDMEARVQVAYAVCKQRQDLGALTAFLDDVRKTFWY